MPDNPNIPFVNSDLVQGTVVRASRIELTPTSQPLNPVEGWIYADQTDHHVYLWNGSAWKQIDNV